MRKVLCEIDLEKTQGYPGRYLESRQAGYNESRAGLCGVSVLKT